MCFSSSAIRTRYASLSLFNRDRYSSCATRWKPIDLNRSWVQDSEGKLSAAGLVWFGVCLLETYFTRCTLNSFPISWRVAQKRAEVTAPGRARRYPDFHDVRRAPAIAPLTAVSGMRVNLISPNVGGDRGPSDTLTSVGRDCLRRIYWFVLNVETNNGLMKYSRTLKNVTPAIPLLRAAEDA